VRVDLREGWRRRLRETLELMAAAEPVAAATST
jgi:hypothetical protein